jgi:exodeoxyribonuclease V alpha subunit
LATVFGTVKKVKYHNEINDWAVIELKTQHGDRFIAKGNLGAQLEGYHLEIAGKWVSSPHGGSDQFDAKSYKVSPPSTEEGVFLFLTSGLFKGLSKKIGRSLVDQFGAKALDHLDADINILNLIDGVGPRKFIQIRDSYKETKPQQEKIFALISEYQFSFTEALQIVTAFPKNTLSIVENNPYSVYRGLSKMAFVRFDRIIMSKGYPKDSEFRVREVINHYMKSNHGKGHTVTSQQQLMDNVTKYTRLDRYVVQAQIDFLIQKKRLWPFMLNGTPVYQMKWLYQCEKEIATRLSRIIETPATKQLVFDESDSRLDKLKEHQRAAIPAPFRHKVSIITGKPGTGKTTLLKTMLDLLEEQNAVVLTCSPTGKASQRLREVTLRHCDTIHRTLGASYESDEFKFDDTNPLECDVLLIDETSMLDTPLTRSILRALPFTCRVVLIGDPDQLPSVNMGAVFRDLINSGTIPVYSLTQVLRITKADGSIPTPLMMAERVLSGLFNSAANDDEWLYVNTYNNAQSEQALVSLIKKMQSKGLNYHDVQVFSPINDDELGVVRLNEIVKNAFTPGAEQKLLVGDKVIQTVNNYDLDSFNGDVGIVKKIDPEAVDDEPYMIVDMNGKEKQYGKKDSYQLALAYAISGHKSQGSEYPHIIIMIPDHYYALMDRYWLNTLITRCQKHCTIIGPKGILDKTAQSRISHLRKTLLVQQLRLFLKKV